MKDQLKDNIVITEKGINIKLGIYSIIVCAFILGGVWWQISDIAGDIKTEKNDRVAANIRIEKNSNDNNDKLEKNMNERFSDLKFFISQGNNKQSSKLEKIAGDNTEIKRKINSQEPSQISSSIIRYDTLKIKDSTDSAMKKGF